MLDGEQRVQVEARNDGKMFIITVGRNIPNLRSKVWRSRVVETMHIYIWGYFFMLHDGKAGGPEGQQHRRSFVPARRVSCMAA